MEKQKSILEGYLSDSKALQNSLIGLSFVQSIGFLYKLDLLLPKLCKFGYPIAAVILFTFLINWVIMIFANRHEESILDKMMEGDDLSNLNFMKSASNRAFYFRISLIGLIDLSTMGFTFIAISIHVSDYHC